MKVNSISGSKIRNVYNENKRLEEKKEVKSKKDSIEISTVGKSLSSYSIDDSFINSPEKIQRIAKEVANGTYNRDSKLVAQKIIDAYKEKSSF